MEVCDEIPIKQYGIVEDVKNDRTGDPGCADRESGCNYRIIQYPGYLETDHRGTGDGNLIPYHGIIGR